MQKIFINENDHYFIIMTSGYLAISFLKQTPLPEKELRIFLSYLPQEPLKEYLYNADIDKGRRNMPKHDLIDMIVTKKKLKNWILARRWWIIKKKANYLKIISFEI